MTQNIQQKHSVLGTMYPDVAYGMEGDTPSFLNLINNGLNDPNHPDYGGWGGRYVYHLPEFENSNTGPFKRDNWPIDEPETRPIWTNTSDSIISSIDKKSYTGNLETILRWREEFQNDFAARMDWTIKSYKEANHPPRPRINHPDHITVKSGDQFYLDATGTTDPDGDALSYLWFQYREAGTFEGNISFRPHASNLYRVPFTAPVVETPKTIHFILKVTDKGVPALTRYQRVIVTVIP